MNAKNMTAHDLIGRKVAHILTCFSYFEGCRVQSLFLQLNMGDILSIPSSEEEPHPPTDDQEKCLVPYEAGLCCEGETIVDVLASEPSDSLLFSNNKLIFGDSPAPSEFNWYIDDWSEGYREEYEFRGIQSIRTEKP